ncbi:MAG: saccharopine dehydrogenase family protein [Longimicrobiales bacterium]
MRVLVLGGGLQGSACAFDLLQNPDVERVRLADVRSDSLAPFLEPYARDPRLERVTVDAREDVAVGKAMHGMDACANALPYWLNLDIARAAVEHGVHCCDLGGNTEIVLRQLELDDAARAKGVSIVPDCGLAPGMVNILAEAGIRELHEVRSVRIFVGGLPQHPMPPLNYQIVYSLEGVLDYYTTPSWIVRDGKQVQVEALSEVEAVVFEQPLGTLEAFHTAGGLSILTHSYEGRIASMEYKTLRYPGHAEQMRTIRSLGLLSINPIHVHGQSVVPRQVFIACAEPRLRRPGARDLVALRVLVDGRHDGEDRQVGWELVDYYDEGKGISAMERSTGYSLAITATMQAAGEVRGSGVKTPDQAVDPDLYIERLARRGLEIRRI